MRLILPAACAIALSACMGGYTKETDFHFDAGPIGVIPGGGGSGGGGGVDGGPDGGPDAGPDGGCTALSLNSTTVIDGCFGGGATFNGSASVSGTTCAASLILGSGATCVGTASGAHDAFDGGCGGFSPCTSTSLPGTIVCVNGLTSCLIAVDGGP